MIQILETYKKLYNETGKEQPMVKSASFISPKEAMAAGEMGCHHATISAQVLTQLAALEYDASKQPGEGVPKPAHPYRNAGPTPARLAKVPKADPLAAANWDGKLARTDIDYLANNGAELQKAIEADPVTKTRLYEALELFKGGELRSRAAIEEAMKQV
jgi:transaldolase